MRVADGRVRAHLCLVETKTRQANQMTALQSLRSFFGAFRAAVHAAAAVDMHRSPDARDLKMLGISQKAFRAIHL
ncbi:hypothetical protein SAMN04488021_10788 [Paracoccus aminovorans]|uniref:Uncharacterized protein n=2 Tax=Paracoccus aminovorans TaxID=34004 RepID=A0A1I2Z782_9RHOB|nr:hypothetical protein JCM7685_pAMV3p0084 [Paracoccus aminovorans]SFH33722.1 hypothetical protein SAMN04488021_10788 [Paracoccus aminovorans]